jgi:hypothetical protein
VATVFLDQLSIFGGFYN